MALEKIAIVGGGIAGLASAIFLSRKGHQITIFDKAKKPSPVGAGFLLQPPGQNILDKLSILDNVLKEAVPIYGLQSSTLDGRKLLDLRYDRLPGNPRNGLGVQRSTIYDALLKTVLNLDNVNVVWDSIIERCSSQINKAVIDTDNGTQHFDLCLLCSGSNSQITDKHFKHRIKKAYGWGCLWSTIKLPESLSPNILHQRCKGSNKMMGILPVRQVTGSYEAALYWSAKTEDLNHIDKNNFDEVKNEIMQFWPAASESIEPLSFTDFVSANYNDIWTPKPYHQRLIALGDISHATSPQLGQGCTMALLDAWSLSTHINAENGLNNDIERWWQSRKKQLSYVRHLSRFLTPLFQSESKACEFARDWLMAPAGRLPVFDRLQLKTLASEVFLTPND